MHVSERTTQPYIEEVRQICVRDGVVVGRIGIVWDFAEQVPLRDVAGSWSGAIEWISLVCKWLANAQLALGTAMQASATQHPLADDSADAVIR